MEIGLLTRIDLLVTREPEKRIFQPKKNTNLKETLFSTNRFTLRSSSHFPIISLSTYFR